ncbi:MerR family transcriptional regulator [Granulosicoccus antarcticus]|uniref:HTH-type transcriptional regulator ZntR n=1 Tax=Granulosicoccus antarcticus IMCC3135 TaxID=1192854 RepID=A0A2Z2NZ25_9GAMM|nr:helix-turn-helix domain-containing protein [Granulosicoccus antarcticus]ASJ74110.1 HTH-type transcriptional regulator ZntR [Granulosicoccus antarcticus IMCC3135]
MVFSIGQLGKLTNTKVPTVRYYEEIGLITPLGRSEGGQRRFDQGSVRRLGFIRHARELGFTLDAIRQLLGLADRPAASCEPIDVIVREQLDEVDRRLANLQAIRDELGRMLSECDGGVASQCRILEVLGDHSLCLTEDHANPIQA